MTVNLLKFFAIAHKILFKLHYHRQKPLFMAFTTPNLDNSRHLTPPRQFKFLTPPMPYIRHLVTIVKFLWKSQIFT